MSTHLFAYGSLMFPEVWSQIVRGEYRQMVALAHNFQRLAVQGEAYPGLIQMSGAKVRGVIYFDVNAADLEALDRFEGEDYRRIPISVNLADGSVIQAQTYLYLSLTRLSQKDWLPENFEMQRFLETYCRAKLENEPPNQA